MTDGAPIKETSFRSIKLKEVDASRAAYDAQHGPPARVSVAERLVAKRRTTARR